MTNDIAISVSNLSKWFDTARRTNGLRESLSHLFKPNGMYEKKPSGFWALQDVSFDVPRGEVVGIVGHNGAGKSVMLKILSGITNPTEGQAVIHGRIGALLELGTGFHPELSGRDNIFLNGSFLGLKRWEIQERIEEIIEFSGIGYAIHEPVKHYSSGMTVRLGFSIAVTLAPEVIFLDEVWAVGDMDFQKKAFQKIRNIISDGRTVMIVSHSLETVTSVSTSCLLMEHGRLLDHGTPDKILRSYEAAMQKSTVVNSAPARETQVKSDPFQRVQQLWQVGAAHNMQGHRTLAVATWAGMLQMQKDYAAQTEQADARTFLGPYWTAGFGHIALLDYFAKCQELGLYPEKFNLVAYSDQIANRDYLEYWSPWFNRVTDRKAARALERAPNRQFPAVVEMDGQWQWIHRAMCEVEAKWEKAGRGPLISLTPQHRAHGETYLRSKGMPADAWFVTLHVREGGMVSGSKDTQGLRNATIDDYLPAIKAITDKGGWVVRIGDNNFKPLAAMPNVIDYAVAKDKDDALDVYLLAACRFALATNSGPAWVAKTFGVPVVLSNWGPIGDMTHAANTITVPRLLWSDAQSRHLRFSEQFQEPNGFLESQAALASHSLRSPLNAPEQITAAVEEMMHCIDQGWEMDAGNAARQQTFKHISANANVLFRGRIAAQFLEAHQDLLA